MAVVNLEAKLWISVLDVEGRDYLWQRLFNY
jgi:hypothetical protein